MFFERKKKINEEIKQALNDDIPLKKKEIFSGEEELPVHMPPRSMQPDSTVSSEDSAPLFVKVEKYKEILISIQEMKIFISATKQIFNVLYDLESVRNDALKILKATLQRLEKSTTEIDVDLLRPRGVDMSDVTSGEAEVHQIQNSLGDLQRQLEDLKKDLNQIK